MNRKPANVDALLDELRHPCEATLLAMRSLLRDASPDLVEGIKWNAPSYSLNGTDILTFFLRETDGISLVFHTGAKGKDTHTGQRLMHDPSGLLEWKADKRAMLRMTSEEAVRASEQDIKRIVRRWVEKAKTDFQPD